MFDHLCEKAPSAGIVAFKKQQGIYESELKKDETDLLDRMDKGTPARAFLHNIDAYSDLIRTFDMMDCLDKGYRQLSNGQSRKLIILSQITKGKSILIVQSPFDGLDPKSCHDLEKALDHLHKKGTTLILFLSNLMDIPAFCSHLGLISNAGIKIQGKKRDVFHLIKNQLFTQKADFRASAEDLIPHHPKLKRAQDTQELVCLTDGFAGFNGSIIFDKLSLTIQAGDHTLISGPNGCGKSTLVHLIIGDHPACYQNRLRIFGKKRGSGESIWDIKKQMGIVSADLHRNYIVPGSVLHCVISGFFDSIGIYRPHSEYHENMARVWLKRIHLIKEANTPFRDLNFAGQRLVLIARSLIKLPRILILDEPTQGLDERNREAILNFFEDIAKKKISTIFYVSHRKDEFRDFFVQHIRMG